MSLLSPMEKQYMHKYMSIIFVYMSGTSRKTVQYLRYNFHKIVRYNLFIYVVTYVLVFIEHRRSGYFSGKKKYVTFKFVTYLLYFSMRVRIAINWKEILELGLG